jgi:hypothetical protein
MMYAGLVTVFASALTVTMPACKKKETSETGDMAYGQTVHGKVTFNGEPVPYGYVLLFHMQNSIDAKSGRLAATCFGEIKGGKYVIGDAPTGVMKVVVAADPDVDQMTLLKPEVLGTPAGGLIGKKSGGGAPDKGPPGKGGPPGGPEGGPEVKPPGFKLPAFNPAAEKLTEAEKEMCKEVHKLYGKFDNSDILYPVKEGDQTFDIILTSAKKK